MTIKAKVKIWSGRLLLLLGAVLLITGLGLAVRNRLEEQAAERSAQALLEQVQQEMVSLPAEPPSGEETAPQPEKPKEDRDPMEGYPVDGILSIPDIGVTLPVLADYSEEFLRVSVCIFEQEAGEEPGQMVLAGHDYRSHFGAISTLETGAPVTYETLSGEKRSYAVTEVLSVDPNDREALDSGDWDMTLITCNPDMSKRVLVRLDRTDL